MPENKNEIIGLRVVLEMAGKQREISYLALLAPYEKFEQITKHLQNGHREEIKSALLSIVLQDQNLASHLME